MLVGVNLDGSVEDVEIVGLAPVLGILELDKGILYNPSSGTQITT